MEIVSKIWKITITEFFKSLEKNIYNISIYFLLIIIGSTYINLIILNSTSKSKLNFLFGQSSIENVIYQAILSRGTIVFAILVIVVFGNELSQSTFKKTLVCGYNRFELFLSFLVKLNLLVIFYVLLSLIIFVLFNNFNLNYFYDHQIINKLLGLYIAFLYVGIASVSIVLLIEKTYLSILIIALLLLISNTLSNLNNLLFNSEVVLFVPFVFLKYLVEPYRLFGNYFFYISFIFYLIFFNWLTAFLISKKRFY